MKKNKPRPEELKDHAKDVQYRGKKYGLKVHDRVGDDGIIESHFDYSPQWRPQGAKHRGNYQVNVELCRRCKMTKQFCRCKER